MPRDVDKRKTQKALRKLRKAAERAELEGIELTDWEKAFVEGVDERLTEYGSAFHDLSKGNADEALSMAQSEILKQLDKKSRGKGSPGFKTRKPFKARKGMEPKRPRGRDINVDIEDNRDEIAPEPPETPAVRPVPSKGFSPRIVNDAGECENPAAPKPSPDAAKTASKPKPSGFRVIQGGKES